MNKPTTTETAVGRAWFRVLIGASLTFAPGVLLAHIPGAPVNSEEYKWADRQMSIDNWGCCGVGDVQVLGPDEWSVAPDGHFLVRLMNTWHDVPLRSRTRDGDHDPNPLGQAVVWWNRTAHDDWGKYGHPAQNFRLEIYCFAPGVLT